MRLDLRVLPAGASSVLLETADGEQAEALHAELLRRRAAGELAEVAEIVPAARTVLVSGLAEPRAFASDVAGWDVPPVVRGRGEAVELPVRFDGPDLAEVMARWGATADEVGAVIEETPFRVAFCGFAPGFGYLTGLPEHLRLPRRATPRTAVPAGSVALAARTPGSIRAPLPAAGR